MNSSLSSRTVFTIIIVGIALIAGGFIISQATPLIFPTQASAESEQIDQLFRIALLIGGAIFLLVQGLLVFSIWRFRAKPGDASTGIDMHGNTTLEITWTAIPAVIVLVLTILSVQVWGSIQSPKADEMLVNVTGARFNWAFSYTVPNPNGGEPLNIRSTELHTYVGRPVRLEMVTQDVIHSFWVPAFRIKQDLLPGRTTTVRFTPTEATAPDAPYPIKCAELCGAAHGQMVGYVVVHESETDYIAWLDAQVFKVLNPPADPVERGRDLLASNVYPCYTCHVLGDLADFQWNGNFGPSLNGIADRAAGSRATTTGLSAYDYLYQSIHEPNVYLVPGFGALMPQLNVPDCEVQAMVAYLCTQSDSGSPTCTVDQEAYAAQCAPAGAAAAPAAEATAEAPASGA
jgi:cytochrome c oxidase subunit 2